MRLFEIVSLYPNNCNKCLSGKVKGFDQVIKGIWWMPWHMKTMKDVVSCDKPRVSANNFRSEDFRMGQPVSGYAGTLPVEHIGWVELTGRIDTSK